MPDNLRDGYAQYLRDLETEYQSLARRFADLERERDEISARLAKTHQESTTATERYEAAAKEHYSVLRTLRHAGPPGTPQYQATLKLMAIKLRDKLRLMPERLRLENQVASEERALEAVQCMLGNIRDRKMAGIEVLMNQHLEQHPEAAAQYYGELWFAGSATKVVRP